MAGRPAAAPAHARTHPHTVDVGSHHDIVTPVHEAAADGCGVLVASTDAKELAALCNRVLVFNDGRLVTELTRQPRAHEIVAATFEHLDQATRTS